MTGRLPPALRRAKALLAAALAIVALGGFAALDLANDATGTAMLRALALGLVFGALANALALRLALRALRSGKPGRARPVYTLVGFGLLAPLLALLLVPAVGRWITGLAVEQHAANAGAACVRAAVGYLAAHLLAEAHRAWHGAAGSSR